MRTTVAGALLIFGALAVGKIASGIVREPLFFTAIALALLVGVGCLIVGPILWVRGARRTKAEEMELLREIAAQGRQVPPTA